MTSLWYQQISGGVATAILAAAAFDLALWLARPKDKQHLYAFMASVCAGLFAVISAAQLTVGATPWNFLLERLEFSSLLLLAPITVAFALRINRRPATTVLALMTGISALFIIVTFATNLVVTSHFVSRTLVDTLLIEPMPGPLAPVMFIYLQASAFLGLSNFFRFAKGNFGTEIMLSVGSLLFVATAVNDILTEFGILTYGYFFNVGIGGLTFCIASIALTNHVAALRKAESASEDLKEAVTAKSLELVDVQARFLQEHQLASLGRLSAGIAHEINNPLAAIQANLTFIGDALPKTHDSNIDDALTESFEACQRASQIVKDLSLFARRRPTKATRTRLAPPVSTALRFLSRAYPNAQHVACAFDSSVEIIGDEAKIAQIATNLIENALHAVEAMPPGLGKVEVSIQRRSDRALLIVSDNGPGVPSDKKTQIFAPFFTTKDIGRGTGLGLAICARLVDDHQGTLRVEDNPGGGARFVVELPLP